MSETTMNQLPKEDLRDWMNELRQDAKYRWPPFRAYYRFRAWKYLLRKDPEMGLLRFLAHRDRLSVDVGANLGLFTYFLARLSPRVLAFEPNPYPLRTLLHVADRNVEVRAEALSDRDGTARLVIPKTRKGWQSNGAGIDKEATSRTMAIEIPCHRIDSLKLDRVGFLKVDVEGHELSVLRGACGVLERDRPNIFLENEHVHAGNAMNDVFSLLRSLNYNGFFLENGRLINVDFFDVERHQLRPVQGYVKNFVFLPSGARD